MYTIINPPWLRNENIFGEMFFMTIHYTVPTSLFAQNLSCDKNLTVFNFAYIIILSCLLYISYKFVQTT